MNVFSPEYHKIDLKAKDRFIAKNLLRVSLNSEVNVSKL